MHARSSRDILADLIAFDTTTRNSNLDLIAYIERYLDGHGVASRRIPNDEGDKASLWVTVGPEGDGGLILNGHTDCVPVDGQQWTTSPFALAERDGRLYGRGTCDMKGFIACVLAALPRMLEAPLARPIHFAFSHDEEIGCQGVRGMLAEIAEKGPRAEACIVGEPTSLQVVTGHKGGRAYRCTLDGLSVHSSLAPTGVNTIEYAARLIVFIRSIADRLAKGPQDADFDLPYSTISVGVIEGGSAVNIVPDRCSFIFEFRNLIEVDQEAIYQEIRHHALEVLLPRMREIHPGADIRFEPFYAYPAHAIAAEHPFVTEVKALVGRNSHSKVAYGAEAGLFLSELGLPTVLCGPGSITEAHRPDEYVEQSQLDACDAFLHRVIERQRTGSGLEASTGMS
jgi:acetylornithine deacetylase